MKNSTFTTSMLVCAAAVGVALAGCHRGNDANAGKTPVDAAQPGAQATQSRALERQVAQGGPANGLGVAGASAAPAGGAPNLQDGQIIATSGSANGVTACAGCHGAHGEGNAASGFPRVAGQPAAYLRKQLGAFANGARVNPIMQPIAKSMNADQIRDVSAYYAGLADAAGSGVAQPAAGGAKPPPGNLERGRVLSAVGDNALGVQACANCHGPGGGGNSPAYPYLAGQHANYLTAAMAEWKNGARKTDDSGQMTHVAQALPDADVAALAAYFSAQGAPPAAGALVNIPAGSSQRPTVAAAAGAPGPSGPGGGTVRGTDAEQGAATTGGGQGLGGGGGTQGNQPQQETGAGR
jgi:cytochrome c553